MVTDGLNPFTLLGFLGAVLGGGALAAAPGESYATDLVFDVPAGARGPQLILRSDDVETPFLIGHENSLLHGKTMFALPRET
jgi:hypothetical protein